MQFKLAGFHVCLDNEHLAVTLGRLVHGYQHLGRICHFHTENCKMNDH